MAESRVKNASRNIAFGLFLKCYQIIVPLLIRTAMMYYMGVNYLGLNGLFTSILLTLEVAELGVGSAMVYSMYKPIIDHDTKTICALLNLYRRCYRIIGLIICIVGLALTPAIPYMIKKDVPADVNLYYVYWLNLLATLMTYWLFAYKTSLLVAHQRNDVVSKVMLCTNTAMYLMQLYMIVVAKNYVFYLIVTIIAQIATNITSAYFAGRMFPDYKPKGKLEEEQLKTIVGKIKDLFTMRIGMVIVTSADSIVISMFLGLSMLGVYQNYFMILTAVLNVIKVIYDSTLSGIGNSILTETKEKNYHDLKKLTFIILWLTGFCCSELMCVFQDFMRIWVSGDEKKMLSLSVVVCFVVYLFVDQSNQVLLTFKDAAGIWHKDRFRPVITAGVNFVLNVIMVQFMGIYGIILSTVASVLLVGMPWLLHNLFSSLFEREMIHEYIKKIAYYAVNTAIVVTTCYFVTSLIPLDTDATRLEALCHLLIKAVICGVLSNAMYIVLYRRTEGYNDAKDLVKRILKRA